MSTDDGKKVAAEWVARMQELTEQRDRLLKAAKAVNALYPLHWDRVDGAAIVMAERVPQFEEAFSDLHDAIHSVRT